jgi:hypothetical protein
MENRISNVKPIELHPVGKTQMHTAEEESNVYMQSFSSLRLSVLCVARKEKVQ